MSGSRLTLPSGIERGRRFLSRCCLASILHALREARRDRPTPEIGLSRLPGLGTITTRLAFFAARVLRQQGLTTSPPNDDPVPAKLKADIYYPVMVRAITLLPNNKCETRQKLYDRARLVLTNKLHRQHSSWIRQEERALELAIRRVEALASVREIISQKLGDPPG